MNREIKFRAWDRLCKRYWYKGFSVSFGGEVTHLSREIQEARIKAGWTLVNSYDEKITGFDLEQSTGLKDCKRTEEYPEGQEIYEGDIIHIWSSFYKKDMPKAIVFWNEAKAKFDIKEPNGLYNNWLPKANHQGWFIEVIGNIHEEGKCQDAS